MVKLLRLTRPVVIYAFSSVNSDQRFDHALNWRHASIKPFALGTIVRVSFHSSGQRARYIYIDSLETQFILVFSFCSARVVLM
jgi:hypothetical protein